MNQQPSTTPVLTMSEDSKTLLLDLCQQSFGWDDQKCNRVYEGYVQFMTLKKNLKDWDDTVLEPSSRIGKMWKEHVCNSREYASFCKDFAGQMILRDSYHHDLNGTDRSGRVKTTKSHLRAEFGDEIDEKVWEFGIDIRVLDYSGRESTVRLYSDTEMQDLFDAIANNYGMDPASIQFEKDGKIIDGSATPSSLGLGDHDVIVCLPGPMVPV